jgi:hypothetical protein
MLGISVRKRSSLPTQTHHVLLMKNWTICLLVSFLTLFSNCSKDKETVSAETLSLLRHQWKVISSTTVFPTNTILNDRYEGSPTDFYRFTNDDSLVIQQTGQVNLPFAPLKIATTYSFVHSNIMEYGISPGIRISIVSISNNLLVLTNTATSIITGGGTSVVYNGTKIDSLSR